jgi:hypothetical protein
VTAVVVGLWVVALLFADLVSCMLALGVEPAEDDEADWLDPAAER